MDISEALEKDPSLPRGRPTTHYHNTAKETELRIESSEEGSDWDHDIARLSLSGPSEETIGSRPPGSVPDSSDRRQSSPAASELPPSQEQLDCFISPSQRREAEELTVAPSSQTDPVSPELDWREGDNSHARRSWGQQRQAAEWAGGRGSAERGNVRQAAEWAGGWGSAGTSGESDRGNVRQAAEWAGGWGSAGTSGESERGNVRQAAEWAGGWGPAGTSGESERGNVRQAAEWAGGWGSAGTSGESERGNVRQAAEWVGGWGPAGTSGESERGNVRQAAEWAGGWGSAGTSGESGRGNVRQAAEWAGGWGPVGRDTMKLLQQTAQWATVNPPQRWATLATTLPSEQYGRPDPRPPTASTMTEEHGTSGANTGAGVSSHSLTQATSFSNHCVSPSHSEDCLLGEEELDRPAIVLEPYSCSGEEGGREEHRRGEAMEDEGGEVKEDEGGEVMEDVGGEAMEDEGEEVMEDVGEEVMEDEGGEVMEDEGGKVREDEGREAVEDEGGEAVEDEGGEAVEGEGGVSRAEERLAQEEGMGERGEGGGVLSGGSSESVRHVSETPVDSEEPQSHGAAESAADGSGHDEGGASSGRECIRHPPETPGGGSEQSGATSEPDAPAPLTDTTGGYPVSTDSDSRVDGSGHPTGLTTNSRVDPAHPADRGESIDGMGTDATVDADHQHIALTASDHRPIDLTGPDATVGSDPPTGSAAGSANAIQSTSYVDVFSQDDIITQEGELRLECNNSVGIFLDLAHTWPQRQSCHCRVSRGPFEPP